ncbi:MAG: TIGR00282 family metallophosphoesterase [candidate division Zixibacteria bacterium]|nr:TIGR00282 family metallophosphoesterase [candidate division Zixibacteria bacterium]
MPLFTLMFIADICGRPGRQAAAHMIKPLKEKYGADYVIANVENAAGGFGVTPEMSRKMFSYGINLQTSGNHIWDRVDIIEYFESQSPKLIRPANYPPGTPGVGSYLDTVGDIKVGVINMMGRTYMAPLDDPFRVAKREVAQLSNETNIIFMDFHAEATSEKQAMMYFLDGRVSAIVGTHTHVQTADEQITARGTAYLTDAGMTGPHDSIIGMDVGPSLGRFLTGMPKRFTCASGDVRISGVVIRVDVESGRAEHIERFVLPFDINNAQQDVFNEPE